MSRDKLRVLHAVYCLGRGGAEKLAIDIPNELNNRSDAEALLIAFDKTVEQEYFVKNENYKFCPSQVNLSVLGKDKVELLLRNKQLYFQISSFAMNFIAQFGIRNYVD